VRVKRRSIVVLVAMVALTTMSFATSCVWGKKFKTRQVCGKVKDAYGAIIPNATVQVKKLGGTEVVAESKTTLDGVFALHEIAGGDYEIRIKAEGFWDASQSFRLSRPAKGQNCARPVRVVMKVAGSCSYVENAWRK
jgi:hypothetical protein